MGMEERQIEWEIDNELAFIDLVEFVQDDTSYAIKVA